MADRVITWNTRKTDAGFEYRVYSFGYQVPAETLKVGVVPTRAMATLRARKWKLFFKAQACKTAA